jgi:hypothetical protein
MKPEAEGWIKEALGKFPFDRFSTVSFFRVATNANTSSPSGFNAMFV